MAEESWSVDSWSWDVKAPTKCGQAQNGQKFWRLRLNSIRGFQTTCSFLIQLRSKRYLQIASPKSLRASKEDTDHELLPITPTGASPTGRCSPIISTSSINSAEFTFLHILLFPELTMVRPRNSRIMDHLREPNAFMSTYW
jgi:hypothetical protein